MADLNANSLQTQLFDSGTNFLSLTAPAFKGVKELFAEVCTYSKMKGVCGVPKGKILFDWVEFNLTSADIALFPEVAITFNWLGMLRCLSPQRIIWSL